MKVRWHIVLLGGLFIVAACKGTESLPSTQPSAASPGRDCCFAACGSLFEASFSPEVDDERLLGSTLSVCRNSECFETTLGDMNLASAVGGSGTGKQFIEPEQREATYGPLIALSVGGRSAPAAPRRLSVSYRPWLEFHFSDGDAYELRLTDEQGAVLFQQSTAVTYALHEVCCRTCGRAILDGGS